MIISFGTCFRGDVVSTEGSIFKTRFFHLWYLPIIPLGGVECIDDAHYEADINGLSLLLGFSRSWLLVFSLLCFCSEGLGVACAIILLIGWLIAMFCGRG